MASTDETPPGSAGDEVVRALADLLRTGTDPDLLAARRLLLQRLATTGDTSRSRIPAPRNITEVGGYLNLLRRMHDQALQAQMLSAALGVAGPLADLARPAAQPVAMVPVGNDRPPGRVQRTVAVAIAVRTDLAPALREAQAAVHAAGCTLPLAAPPFALPVAGPAGGPPQQPTDDEVLGHLGRLLLVAPGTLLRDPETDPLALGRRADDGEGLPELLARVTAADPAAVTAPVAPASWRLYRCDDTACELLPAAEHRQLPLGPVLAAAGWYAPDGTLVPQSAGRPGGLAQLVNVTGLLPGRSTLGGELHLLHPPASVQASPYATRLGWVWDGARFVAP